MGYEWYDSNEFNDSQNNREENRKKCPWCNGSGTRREYYGVDDDYITKTCHLCSGSGNRNVYVADKDEDDDWYGL